MYWKFETSSIKLWNDFSELALMAQTLQATSEDIDFFLKNSEVSWRTKIEEQMGKAISVYSAPFYTSWFGYKMCLRLYLNCDGSGKGTHLSFFLIIMRGEYDALLSWPFKHMVTAGPASGSPCIHWKGQLNKASYSPLMMVRKKDRWLLFPAPSPFVLSTIALKLRVSLQG